MKKATTPMARSLAEADAGGNRLQRSPQSRAPSTVASQPALESAIYEGLVVHRRHSPHAHAFRYRMAMLFLDLGELDRVFRGRWLWSTARRNLAEFRRSDFLGDPSMPLEDAVRARVAEAIGRKPEGPIRLLTHLRYFGHSFNPVSFYYCYEADGRSLDVVVAEITNTPWKQRHAYVLPVADAERRGTALAWRFEKRFHVSPFMAMEHDYAWRLMPPGETLGIHMDVMHRGPDRSRAFDATLTLQRKPIEAKVLARLLWRFPLMTTRIVAAIHWQALRLWLRGNPVHDHPEKKGCPPMSNPEITENDATSALADFGQGTAPWFERILRRRLLGTLTSLRDCRITVEEAGQKSVLGTPAGNPADTLHAHVRIHDPAFYRQIGLNGSVGAGEAYMDGLWDCDDLVALTRILVRNRDHLDAMETGLARVGGWAMRGWSALLRNTRRGSRRNIAAHYDLGNDLFALFLDQDMMYSSALFEADDESLETASTRKLDRICRKLGLGPGHHVLEIGTGWGGFALHAARHYGCRVTTTTISREQHDLARRRVDAAGLADRITLLLEDYRDLEGQYDRVVSIEMIEAIGHQYLDTYFRTVNRLLKQDGMALIQAITIEDHRYRKALKAVDFIKRYIFPGSFIPSIGVMAGALARTSDMKLFNLEDIGPSYALTLRAWRQRFVARIDEVRALGYPERFIRMWLFYLTYCEGGFLERSIGDVQMLLCKPDARPPQFTPGFNSGVE